MIDDTPLNSVIAGLRPGDSLTLSFTAKGQLISPQAQNPEPVAFQIPLSMKHGDNDRLNIRATVEVSPELATVIAGVKRKLSKAFGSSFRPLEADIGRDMRYQMNAVGHYDHIPKVA